MSREKPTTPLTPSVSWKQGRIQRCLRVPLIPDDNGEAHSNSSHSPFYLMTREKPKASKSPITKSKGEAKSAAYCPCYLMTREKPIAPLNLPVNCCKGEALIAPESLLPDDKGKSFCSSESPCYLMTRDNPTAPLNHPVTWWQGRSPQRP